MPGDDELTAQYGVSRHTVREAVRRLQIEGVVERGRGRGTFVKDTMIEQPLGAIYSLFRSVEEQGFAQRSIVRRLEERSDAQAAGVLNCPPSAPLIYLERLRLADGIPIVLDCSWLPAVLARPLLGVDFTHTALYHELHVRCGVQPDAGWERIRPVLPNPEQRAGTAGTTPSTSGRAPGHLADDTGGMAAQPGPGRPVLLRRPVVRPRPGGPVRARHRNRVAARTE